jgi:hypothetical protein
MILTRRAAPRALARSASRLFATATEAAAPKAAAAWTKAKPPKQTNKAEEDALYAAKTIAHRAPPQPVDQTGIPTVDWANSFHGISSQPVTEEQFAALMAPLAIKDIEVKPDGVIYLPEIKYRRRLNEAFGPMGWGMIPKGEAVVGGAIVTREYALIVGGRYVTNVHLLTGDEQLC